MGRSGFPGRELGVLMSGARVRLTSVACFGGNVLATTLDMPISSNYIYDAVESHNYEGVMLPTNIGGQINQDF